MIQHKFQNIKELKANKAHKVSETVDMSFLNEFLLNMLFNQIKVLMKFDPWSWPENVPSEDTSQ